jgi:ribosomal protein S12 methylthiotransferase accessory factor
LEKNLADGDDFMRYQMERVGTKFSIGWFACLPSDDLDFEAALEYIREHPYDDFMHKYLLELTGTFGPNLVDLLIKEGKENDPYLLALMYETCILNDKLGAARARFDGIDVKQLAEYTPLIYINWSRRQNQGDNLYWVTLFSENIYGHKPLPSSEYLERAVPFDPDAVKAWKAGVVPIEDLLIELGRKVIQKRPVPRLTPEETARRAMEKLKARDLMVGPETGTQASLSPYALLMPWKLAVSVSARRNRWQLTGIQTSYGKGLNIHEARASYLMEMVERYSAFASFHSDSIPGYKKSYPVVKATYEDLAEKGHDALSPNDMNLEVPYQNQELYWIPADRTDGNGHHPIYVPAQLVFLFCNLDEISLTSGLPSNGLAAGNTLEEAKLSALLEVIERDAERVVPYSRDRCFLLESDDHRVKDILKGSVESGVHVQFLDITPEFGVPCYKAFIRAPGGEILKGCGAGLDGKRAAVSALTEVPYSHSQAGGSVPAPDGLRTIRYEELPDYSTGDVGEDLKVLETLLIKNGYHPIYVDLTRADLDIPVVRALVPGLEMITDFDRLSSLSLRQFVHSGYCNGI